MRRRRLPLGVILPIGLVVLVGVLAALQYRWLGQVSEAERDQLSRSLHQQAREFADDFDRELGQIYSGLQMGAELMAPGQDEAFAARVDRWRSAARFPELVAHVYAVTAVDGRPALRRYDDASRSLVPAEWPDHLSTVRQRFEPLDDLVTPGERGHVMALNASPLMPEVPAIVVPARSAPPVPEMTMAPPRSGGSLRFESRDAAGLFLALRLNQNAVVAELDPGELTERVLPAFVARHFPERAADRYRVSIVDDDRTPVVVRVLAQGETIDPARADVVTPFFGLRLDSVRDYVSVGQVMTWSTSGGRGAAAQPTIVRRGDKPDVSVFVEQRSTTTGRVGVASPMTAPFTAMHVSTASWLLLLQHADGSLDAAVANARTRNLWLSFGILGVLGVGVGLVVLNARRSERLAEQQMDFVATVSHELRTPLAVIRSAAQNLSAGVVHDASQARRYGDLIEDEGRRLTDMVEQVLEYAGLSGNRRPVRAEPIDPGRVAQEVVAACGPLVAAEGFDVEVAAADDLPFVLADEQALRRALNNLVTNALKYGRDGRWLGVSVQAATHRGQPEVQIAVSDRGRGIDAQDLPHIFEPFYRGQYALERQIQGNGLGLSLVRRIAEAHGGRVTVKSSPGAGTTFTLHLPAASPDAARPALEPLPETGGSAV